MEHNSDNNAENKKADEFDVKTICASLGHESLNTPLPTGWEKTRPFKIVIDSKSQRNFLLENARFISSKTPESHQNVIIAKDPTQNKGKTGERKYRKSQRKNIQAPARQQQLQQQQPALPMDIRTVTPPTKHYMYRDHQNFGIKLDSLPTLALTQ